MPASNHHHRLVPSEGEIPFAEKIEKLLRHWVKHNHDHVQSYRKWARDADDNGIPGVADKLERAAQLTDDISAVFEEALAGFGNAQKEK